VSKNELTKADLLVLTLERDDQLNVRMPKELKRQLKHEAKASGFRSVADLVLAILAKRPKGEE
jgi:predicted HicB family RNase H-like nuclease